LLLGILDKATLTLGDNRRVDFSNCVIFMTSNLGATELSTGLGFQTKEEVELTDQFDARVKRSAEEAARRKFSPEFMNRLDKIVVFKTLRDEELQKILDIELGMVQQRVLMAAGANQFVFTCTPAMKDFLLAEGRNPRYGARHLKRAIEKELVSALSNLVASRQVKLGDFIKIDRENGETTYIKEAEGAMVPELLERYSAAQAAPEGKKVL